MTKVCGKKELRKKAVPFLFNFNLINNINVQDPQLPIEAPQNVLDNVNALDPVIPNTSCLSVSSVNADLSEAPALLQIHDSSSSTHTRIHPTRKVKRHPPAIEKLINKNSKLVNDIKVLNRKINRREKRVIKLTKDDIISGASQYLVEESLNFFKMQLNHDKQRKSEEDEKQFALGLYYKSPKAYKYFLEFFKLPCLTLIHEWVNNISLRPGTNRVFIEQLKVKLESKSIHERQSVLMWDEIMIKPGLEFSSKYNILEGYHDLSDEFGGRKDKIANYILVFMLGGLTYDWKQPFFYLPSAGNVSANDLELIIPRVIELAFEAGFIVRYMTCDQSSCNTSAVNKLGISHNKPFYKFKDNDIAFGFDVPHIFKCIRNSLILHDFKVNDLVVSWGPIKKLYELEKGKICKAAHKLSDKHINPGPFDKMKVSLAVQVFSHSVSTGSVKFIFQVHL
ncbi:hypothetical protein TKK_0001160 [Trichogramma kaykai]